MPDAESIEPRFKFDWLAKALGDLGLLIKSQIGLRKLPPPFFFDFFVAVDEGWWAMDESWRQDARQPQGICHSHSDCDNRDHHCPSPADKRR